MALKWIRAYFDDLFGAHLDGLRAIRGLPLLFAAIIGWEFAQHVVEVRIGRFESRDAARAGAMDGTRMLFGSIKMIAVYIGGFFVLRHLAKRAGGVRVDPFNKAFPRYLPYLAYTLSVFAMIFYAKGIVQPEQLSSFRTIVALGQVAVEPLLMLWVVSSATDGSNRGPLASAKTIGLLYLYALPLFFLGRIPVNAAHQLLNMQAVGQS